MMLHAERDLLASLYTATPKVMVMSPGVDPGSVTAPDNKLCWLDAHLSDTGNLVVAEPGTGPSASADLQLLELPPTNVWAIWLSDRDHDQAAHALTVWWTQAGGDATVPEIVKGDRADLDRALLARALGETRELRRANELLLRDIAALRESWESHVRVPQEMEDLVENLRLAPPRLVFASPSPTGEIAVPTTSGAAECLDDAAELRQRLPMSARGLVGVDLHVAHPGSRDGGLEVELISVDAGATLARWRIPPDTLRAGWLPLRLETASALSWRSLELRVASLGRDAPRLGTCPVGLLGEYGLAAPDDGNRDDDGPTMLVLRAWGGLPGLGVGGDTAGAAPLPLDPVLPVPETVAAKVRLTREITAAFPCFGYLKTGGILLRPLRGTPSAAHFTLPATPGLVAVSCDVMIDDRRCETRKLGARIVVTPCGCGPDEAERGDGALATSDWVDLDAPLECRRLVARLATPVDTAVDLHLFTRLPKGGSIRHARIVFRRFETEVHAGALWEMQSVLPIDAVPLHSEASGEEGRPHTGAKLALLER